MKYISKKIKGAVLFFLSKVCGFFLKSRALVGFFSKRYWKHCGVDYEEFYQTAFHDNRHRKQVSFAMESFVPLLKKTDVVADVGCADGWFMRVLSPFVSQMCGYEISKKMIEIGREKDREAGISNIEYITLDVSVDKLDGSFDQICCMGLFTCLSAHEGRIVSHLYDHLKEDGCLFVRDILSAGDRFVINHLKYAAVYRSEEEYLELFEQRGFRCVARCVVGEHESEGRVLRSTSFVFRRIELRGDYT